METIATLTSRYAQPGRVEWIGLRSKRLADIEPVDQAALTLAGLEGDHSRQGKRAVTLIQAEHLPVIAALAALDAVAPDTLRRNLVISGLNLNGFRNKQLRIGAALVEITGVCAPCSRMEAALGPGGYTAMRGHGGWCAQVVHPGLVQIGDPVAPA